MQRRSGIIHGFSDRLRQLVILSTMLAATWTGMPTMAHADGATYTALAFHDVVDREEDLGYDAITTDQLIRLFDWLKGEGWTVISLDDIDAARAGRRKLPLKAVLLTFDDGYQSVYDRVYPLLLAYHYPAVIALTGSWISTPPDGPVDYGNLLVPRSHFLTWPEVREMAASGLVEVASHSYGLHTEVLANPQGTTRAAAATWIYDPKTGNYESDKAYRQRIADDLTRAYLQITAETGKPPRTLVWPYGRYTLPALEAAKAAGFSRFLSLTEGQTDVSQSDDIHRLYVFNRPKLQDIAAEMEPAPLLARTSRIACLTLDRLAAQPDAAAQDAELGQMIDTVYGLGANVVVLDATATLPAPGTPLDKVFFPTAQRPLATDILGRAVWQIRSRAGVEVYLRLPLAAARAALGDDKIGAIYADLLKSTMADGLVIEATPALLSLGADAATPPAPTDAETFRRRAAVDASTLDADSRAAVTAWQAATAMQPQVKLMLELPAAMSMQSGLQHRWPAPIADLLLLPAAARHTDQTELLQRLKAGGWLQPGQRGRVALTLPPAADTHGVTAAMRAAQVAGATAFALCPGENPGASLRDLTSAQRATLFATFSATTYPLRP